MALMIFSQRSGKNMLTGLNPLVKLICLVLLSAAAAYADFIQLASLLAFMLVIAACIRMPLPSYLKGTPSLPILTVFIFFTELLVSKSILNGLYDASDFFYLIMLGMIMMDTTGPDELAASAGSFLSRFLGKKAWAFSSDIMLTLSMIPRIFSTSRVMMQARKARSGRFFSHPVRNLADYTLSLFLMLLDDLRNFDLALECRLYDPLAARSAPGYRFRDLSAIIISLGIFLWTKLF